MAAELHVYRDAQIHSIPDPHCKRVPLVGNNLLPCFYFGPCELLWMPMQNAEQYAAQGTQQEAQHTPTK